MPVRCKLSAEGLWAWIAEHPAAARRDRIATALRKAQKQAISEWTQLVRSDVGLALRFRPEAFGVLSLTPRSPKYQQRQLRTLGQIYPYVGPLAKGDQKSPSGTMRRDVLGGGYAITNKNSGGDTVTTQLSITGAKILNTLGTNSPQSSGKGPIYRREFLGLDRGGRKDAAWITARANELTLDLLKREFSSARKQFLRIQGDAQNSLYEGAA